MSNAKEIYDILTAAGMSRAGALGMLGNMMAESGLVPNIAQRGMTKLTDAQYTAAADNGLIDFANDAVGYGLYQLTYKTRKAGYLAFCKARGCSVGDLKAQCDYCVKELKEDYPSLWKTLCESDNVNQCCDLICTQFERPAVNNLLTRRNFAAEIGKEIPENPTYTPPKADPVQATFPPDPSVWSIQLVMQYNGYWGRPDGHKSKDFFSKLKEFVADMESC